VLFPIRDNQPTFRTPYVTIGLIVINAVIFLYTQVLGPDSYGMFLVNYGYTPGLLFGSEQIVLPSWLYVPSLLTPISSMFLHGGWMHLIGNMVFLWIYGNNVEDYFGPVKFIIFYILSGLAAIVLYTVFNPGSNVPLVGASGAIAGIMGAYMVLHPRAEITCLLFFFFITFVTLSAKVVLGLWFLYQVIMSMAGSSQGGGVAWLAHVGGFVFGWGILKILVKFRRGGFDNEDRQRVYRVQW